MPGVHWCRRWKIQRCSRRGWGFRPLTTLTLFRPRRLIQGIAAMTAAASSNSYRCSGISSSNNSNNGKCNSNSNSTISVLVKGSLRCISRRRGGGHQIRILPRRSRLQPQPQQTRRRKLQWRRLPLPDNLKTSPGDDRRWGHHGGCTAAVEEAAAG